MGAEEKEQWPCLEMGVDGRELPGEVTSFMKNRRREAWWLEQEALGEEVELRGLAGWRRSLRIQEGD